MLEMTESNPPTTSARADNKPVAMPAAPQPATHQTKPETTQPGDGAGDKTKTTP